MFVVFLYLLNDRYEGITIFFGRLLFFPLFPAIGFYLYEVTAPTLHKFFPATFTNTGRRVNPSGCEAKEGERPKAARRWKGGLKPGASFDARLSRSNNY
jgi:hypothetical protein